ncbi:hypothetical protein GTY79_04450, partial [Streptomyces sp. SID8385]|nr:hypothetical protein [Streptomyces sp. SID8385]
MSSASARPHRPPVTPAGPGRLTSVTTMSMGANLPVDVDRVRLELGRAD